MEISEHIPKLKPARPRQADLSYAGAISERTASFVNGSPRLAANRHADVPVHRSCADRIVSQVASSSSSEATSNSVHQGRGAIGSATPSGSDSVGRQAR